MSSSAEKEPGKVKFMSKEWWKHFLSAFNIRKYGPRELAIWNLSSQVTLVQIFGISKLLSFIPASLVSFFSSVGVIISAIAHKLWGVVATAAVGLFELFTP